jgi:UDP-glucuronate decarboxylase
MRILITGGAGFIGSHLCEILLDENHDIICLDNFFTGSKNNILHLMDNHRFEVIRHDIVQPILLEVDQIYHFACPASPIHYQYNPVKTIKTNIMGTINMLGLAKRVRSRIMLASTSEVYGDPKVHPQSETYWGHVNCIGIRSCYDEGKRAAETLMMDYHRQNDVDIKIIRIFNTYGPRMAENDGRVVSNFILQALRNENITVYGDGRQTRSFQYIDDLISGIVLMMKSHNFTGPVNLGNPNEFTILELAQMIIDLTASKSKIIHESLPSDDPTQRQPDIGLAKKQLNWQPGIELKEGLTKTIDYFEKCLSG